MDSVQQGILSEETSHARYLLFSIEDKTKIANCLDKLVDMVDGESIVIGIGYSLVSALGCEINGLYPMAVRASKGIEVPSTPAALWCWLRGTDRGELYHRSRKFEALLEPAFILEETIDTFQYNDSRDLTGYEDGTENPKGDEAISAAVVQDTGAGMDGSSFVVVQQWLHDFEQFDAMSTEEQDNAIGRRISDNEEIEDAPESAHVKRTAQESFTPEAFMLRRSMPWTDGMNSGLYFVAFGKSFYAFEAQMNRMLGMEDEIIDGIFQFTRPLSGAYFWCPPMRDGKLNFKALS